MWSLTSTRAKRIGGPEKFRPSGEKDFFNTICQKRTHAARAKPLDVPESGGEIAMDDGSIAVAEPLGQGEAYLVRRPASRRAGAAQGEALERAEGRARELARKRATPSRAGDPGPAGEVESALPSPGAGERLSAYLEAAIDCVIVADASGRIVEFNPAAERTFGYSRQEAL